MKTAVKNQTLPTKLTVVNNCGYVIDWQCGAAVQWARLSYDVLHERHPRRTQSDVTLTTFAWFRPSSNSVRFKFSGRTYAYLYTYTMFYNYGDN